MLKKIVFAIASLVLVLVNTIYAQSQLRFHIPVFPPYMFEKDGKISGTGVELVEKILKEAGIQYEFKICSNYGKALTDLKNEECDGFFLASQSAERDDVAVFSNMVVMNKWCWFYPADKPVNPKDTNFKAEARVGTHLNSNTHKWLQENGYHVTGAPSNIDSILKMLKENRTNVVFLSEAVFLDTLGKVGENPENYKSVLQTEKPFGIYVSKQYVSKNPGVMEKINAAIVKVIPKK